MEHKTKITLFFTAVLLLFGFHNASAATINAASCSRANVQSAVDQANDSDEVVVPNGSCSWSGSVSLNNHNGVSVICASEGGCNIAFSGGVFAIDYTPQALTGLIRVSGFNFSGTPGTAAIWFLGTEDIEKVRIDHNTFNNFGQGRIAILFGAVDSGINGKVWGVVDNNTFTGSGNFMGVKNLSGQDAAWTTGLQGSGQNLFIEDNYFSFTGAYDGGTGCMDAWNGGNTVFRHNTTGNCRVVSHGVCHNGPPNFEVYENDISVDDGYRLIHHQGSGEFIVFNNTLSNDHIELLHYRACSAMACDGQCNGSNQLDGNRFPQSTYYGYPCYRQPGRDVAGTLKPIYVWNNRTFGGQKSDLWIDDGGYCSSPSMSTHVKENRDFYNAVSNNPQTTPTDPFNGSTGMGFGTLANRPTSCTPSSEALDAGDGGVGYWATDTQTLYRCTSANTWVPIYTPYTYPHPLRNEGQQEPSCGDGTCNGDETCSDCPGDCGICPRTYGLADFVALLADWLTPGGEDTDVNSDNIVNAQDLGIMMSGWE